MLPRHWGAELETSTTISGKHARGLVIVGNFAQFDKNGHLRKFLLSTGDAILVEASPYDRIWGIGMHADVTRAIDPRSW
jgi:ribA/ribD-fused uncharacterized protein